MNEQWLATHETIDNDARRYVLTATDVQVIWAIALSMYLEAHGIKPTAN